MTGGVGRKAARRGFFFTFEGPEGAGKTTQIKMLRDHLERRGHRCVLTREPGGTVIAEQLRDLVKYHRTGELMTDEAELLLIAAGRAQHVRNLILPALERGEIVLCDRFFDSTTAYQGYARGIDLGFIGVLNGFASCGCVPCLTFLLDVSPEVGFRRTAGRLETVNIDDRIESAGAEFHRRVRDGFLRVAAAEPARVRIIDADDTPENVNRRITVLVEDALRTLR